MTSSALKSSCSGMSAWIAATSKLLPNATTKKSAASLGSCLQAAGQYTPLNPVLQLMLKSL